MKCKDWQHELISLVYGEIEPDAKERLNAHLATCESCQQVYQELTSTSQMLNQWEDEEPNMNFVFIQQPRSFWSRMKERTAQFSWQRKLGLGLPGLAIAALLLLSLFNFKATYESGRWDVSFSLSPRQNQPVPAQLTQALQESQKETLMLLSNMIQESEYQQQARINTTLARFAETVNQQRQRDLQMVGQDLQQFNTHLRQVGLGLEGLHQTTEGRFNQTNTAINDLMKMTGYSVERKN